MPRHLPLTALRACGAAARIGSFRMAADDLGLTPSAVSHAIRGLERDLGAVLFERQGRSIRTVLARAAANSVQQVRGEREGVAAVGGRWTEAPPCDRPDSTRPHQPLDPTAAVSGVPRRARQPAGASLP